MKNKTEESSQLGVGLKRHRPESVCVCVCGGGGGRILSSLKLVLHIHY